MTTERARQEWEYFERTVLPAYIERLNNLEEQKTDLDLKKKEIIREIADRIDQFRWMNSDEISRYLKKVLKGVVAERTIEDALGKKHKRPYESLPRISKPQSAEVDDKKVLQISSSGEEEYNDEEEEEQEGHDDDDDIPPEPEDKPHIYEGGDYPDLPAIEHTAEIALSTIEILKGEKEALELRLNEALKLADDKDKALEKERIQYANLEVELGEAKKKAEAATKTRTDLDSKEELQIKYDELKLAYNELLEVERLRTSRSDFQSAATLPKRAWVAAINAINFHKILMDAKNYALDHNDPWKKILFDVGPDGQLKGAKLEGESSNLDQS